MTGKAALQQRCRGATCRHDPHSKSHKNPSGPCAGGWRRIGATFAISTRTASRGPGHELVVSIDCCHPTSQTDGVVHIGGLCVPLLSGSTAQEALKSPLRWRGRLVFIPLKHRGVGFAGSKFDLVGPHGSVVIHATLGRTGELVELAGSTTIDRATAVVGRGVVVAPLGPLE